MSLCSVMLQDGANEIASVEKMQKRNNNKIHQLHFC